MKGTSLFSGFIALLLTITLVSSCKKNDTLEPGTNNTNPSNNYNPPAVTFSATVQGFVVDEAGNAVSGADVKTGAKTIKTDVNGYYRIENAPFTGDFCYIKAEKKGFFTGSTTIHGKTGSEYAAELVLVPQNNIVSFPAAQGKSITLQSGAKVELPANGFVTSTGKAYTGNVNVAVKHIDPMAKNFSSLIPGGDLRAFDAKGQNVILYSYGMLNVEMRDDAGNLLQLASGVKSTLTIPVAQTMLANAPATIPLWYFDEIKGIWIEEGSATLQGNNYVGTVSHFTPWNCDKPYPPSKVIGKIVDEKGKPLKYAKIKVDQRIIKLDNKGAFTVTAISNSQVVLDVYDGSKGELIGVQTIVNAPNANEVKDLGTIVFKNISMVYLDVRNCNDLPFVGYALVKQSKLSQKLLVTNEGCSFVTSNLGGEAEFTFCSADLQHTSVKQFAIPASQETINLGKITVCGKNNVIQYFSFTYQRGNDSPVNVSVSMPPITSCTRYNSYTNIIFSDASSPSASDHTYKLVFGYDGDKPGTFILGSKPYFGFSYSQQNNFTDYILSENMELVIDKFGTKPGEVVSGTFSGKAKNGFSNVTITNGKFESIRTD